MLAKVACSVYAQPGLDPESEKKLRRKIDRYIVPLVALLYLFSFIDRANIGKTELHGFDSDKTT